MLVDTAFKYPADLEKAKKHRLANRIFKGITSSSNNNERCQCCDKRVGQENVETPYCYSPVGQLVFLGPGVPLLFVFIQNGLMVLITFTLVFTIFALTTNLAGNNCIQDSKCVNSIFNLFSLSNKIGDNLSVMIQGYLIAGFLVLYLFLSQIMYYRIRKNNLICDQIINSPSDYSIIIKNLPENVQKKDIQKMINQFRMLLNNKQRQITKDLSIKKIILSYSLREYLEQKNAQEEEFLKIKKEDESLQFIRRQIARPTKTASFAIVIFDKQVSKEMFFEDYYNQKTCGRMLISCESSGSFKINDKPVMIKRAPQPDDILWQNADIPKCQLYRNIFLSYFFGILILVSGGIIQYYLQYFQQNLEDKDIQSYFSYATSIIVTIYNSIIVQFLIFVTKLEGHETKTSLDQSLLVKISLYSFFNAGIFYSLANILAQQINNFDIQGTFSFEVTLFIIMNAVPPNLTNLVLNKIEFPAFIFRYLLEKGCFKYTQKQANQLFEMKSVDFPVQYAYVIKTIWVTCFYAPFAPIVVPISIFGLIFFYFTQGQLFRANYSAPNMISINITRSAMRLLDFTGTILASGQILIVFYIKYIFKSTFTPAQEGAIGLCLALSILLIIFPSLNVNKILFQFDNKFENQAEYDTVLNEFQTTYQVTYPLSEPSERRKRSDIHLYKFLQILQHVELKDVSNRSSSKPLLDLLIKNKDLSQTRDIQKTLIHQTS